MDNGQFKMKDKELTGKNNSQLSIINYQFSITHYSLMKDSGIEWIGEIPDGWSVKKIKYISKLQGGFAFKSDDFTEIGIPIIRIGDIKDRIEWDSCKKVPNSLDIPEEFLLKTNDTLIALSGATTGKTCFVAEEPNKTFINQRVAKVSFKNKLLYFNISCDFVQKLILLTADGSAQENISTAQIENIDIALPPPEEQTAIANYLDRKTAEIDDLIAKKEKLLELYAEEKTAVINSAVTGRILMDNGQLKIDNYPLSINNCQFKESGIEWLDHPSTGLRAGIPAHWEVKKLKYVKEQSKNSFVDGPFGSHLKTQHFIIDGDVYVIDSGYVTSGQFEINRGFKTISLEHFNTIRRSECNEDDIIIAKIGANFGMSGILPKLDKPSVVSGNSLKLTINKEIYVLKFIHYQLLNIKKLGLIDIEVKGSAQPALSMGLMSEMPFLKTTKEEQAAIVAHIEKESARIDAKVAKTKKLIELLKEYRTALISEAVTGKIKVQRQGRS